MTNEPAESSSSGLNIESENSPGEPTVQLTPPDGFWTALTKLAAETWNRFVGWASEYSGFNRQLDAFLKWARTTFHAGLFDRISDGFEHAGHVAVLVAQVFAVAFGVVGAVTYSDWLPAVQGLAYAALLLILQYTAEKFLGAGRSLVGSSPSRLGSKAFLDSVALLAEVAGVLALVALSYAAHDAGNWNAVWLGLGVWAVCDAVACVALHPALANVTVTPDLRAGEEAIGILSFSVKAAIRVVPVAFGTGAVLGALGLASGTFSLLIDRNPGSARGALALLVSSLALPFASYLLFALYHLVMDVLGSVLALPEKLDRMSRK